MISVFDQEYTPVFIEDDSRNADRVSSLYATDCQVEQTHNEGETAE